MPKAKKNPAEDERFRNINKRFDPAVAIDKIQPHPDNAREGDLGALTVSIDRNGFYGALVVQESTGHILAGNHRYRAAISQGATTVPVIFVQCDDRTAKRILIADNRSNDLASWNLPELATQLEAIRLDEGTLAGVLYDEEDLQRILSDIANGYVGTSESGGASGGEADAGAPDVPVTPEVGALLNEAWTMIADNWSKVGTPEFRWLSPDLTPGVAAWHFIRAKHLNGDYPRKMSLAFTPSQLATKGDRGSCIELLKKISEGDNSLIPRLRFALGDTPVFNRLNAPLPMAGHKMPLDFPATIARDLINDYCPDGGSVLDPCHGWGGRCVGFLLSRTAKRYIGCDPSPTVHEGVKHLNETLGQFAEKSKSVALHRVAFEDFNTKEAFDFALTSPPYFDREKYDGADSSFRRYKTFDGWVAGFYKPLIAKTFALLKPSAAFALQVGSQAYPLADTGKAIANEIGFALEDSTTQLLTNSQAETEDGKSESLFLFRKPAKAQVRTRRSAA